MRHTAQFWVYNPFKSSRHTIVTTLHLIKRGAIFKRKLSRATCIIINNIGKTMRNRSRRKLLRSIKAIRSLGIHWQWLAVSRNNLLIWTLVYFVSATLPLRAVTNTRLN